MGEASRVQQGPELELGEPGVWRSLDFSLNNSVPRTATDSAGKCPLQGHQQGCLESRGLSSNSWFFPAPVSV